jgi:hypothetical protein
LDLEYGRGPQEQRDHHSPEKHEPLDFRKEIIDQILSSLAALHYKPTSRLKIQPLFAAQVTGAQSRNCKESQVAGRKQIKK